MTLNHERTEARWSALSSNVRVVSETVSGDGQTVEVNEGDLRLMPDWQISLVLQKTPTGWRVQIVKSAKAI